jgi:hypothetical protein
VPANRAKYKLRKQTVEPVFAILKQGLGFRQFLLPGIANVKLERSLVTLAYNTKRQHCLDAIARAEPKSERLSVREVAISQHKLPQAGHLRP